jgi:hypothetical protein
MNKFILKNIFIKVYIYHFLINIFINKELKLGFGDHIVIINDFLYMYGGWREYKVGHLFVAMTRFVHQICSALISCWLN